MKFIHQTKCEQSIHDSFVSEKGSTHSDKKNSHNPEDDTNFHTETKNQINNFKLNFSNPQRAQTQCNSEDLVERIAKMQKSQIKSIGKLFLQLAFSLSLEPKNISKIKPQRGFVSNLIELMRQRSPNQQNQGKNLLKVRKVFLNSILYILVLLINATKQNNKNQQLKNKLFKNKTFLKSFIEMDIYKHRKISKLYGIVVVYIYKQNHTLNLKKQLVHSILRNLKFIDHDKTELNLSMILNQLKSFSKLKENFLICENVLQRIHQIYLRNKHTFQSVYTLSYLLHLLYEFPNTSSSIMIQKTNFEITEETEKLLLSSNFYERTYSRYLEFVIEISSKEQKMYSIGYYLGKMDHHANQAKLGLIYNSKLLTLILRCIQKSIKSVQNEQEMIQVLQKGLIPSLISVGNRENLENFICEKVQDLLLQCINKLQSQQTQLSQTLCRYLTHQIQDFQSENVIQKVRRQKLLSKISQKNRNSADQWMQLQ